MMAGRGRRNKYSLLDFTINPWSEFSFFKSKTKGNLFDIPSVWDSFSVSPALPSIWDIPTPVYLQGGSSKSLARVKPITFGYDFFSLPTIPKTTLRNHPLDTPFRITQKDYIVNLQTEFDMLDKVVEEYKEKRRRQKFVEREVEQSLEKSPLKNLTEKDKKALKSRVAKSLIKDVKDEEEIAKYRKKYGIDKLRESRVGYHIVEQFQKEQEKRMRRAELKEKIKERFKGLFKRKQAEESN